MKKYGKATKNIRQYTFEYLFDLIKKDLNSNRYAMNDKIVGFCISDENKLVTFYTEKNEDKIQK